MFETLSMTQTTRTFRQSITLTFNTLNFRKLTLYLYYNVQKLQSQ